MFRALRWPALAAVAPLLWACNARSLEKPTLKPEQNITKTFEQSINRNVDLLFMVDDSSSMRLSQDNLRRNFPTFMTRLQEPPGLPNIHVAVVSSDMGAYNPAGSEVISSCTTPGPSGYGGNDGVFQYSVPPPAVGQAPCTTGLDPGATFISNVAGVKNYTGNLEDVFSCIAALGDQGCGFEHQFASVLRALGADDLGAPPVENQGFLRKDAYLVVILITNEDDCSAPPGVALFDTTANNLLGDQLGPSANFRCNEFGHLCSRNGGPLARPDRHAPNNDVNATVGYDMCISNDTDGFVVGVKDTANRLKALKRNADQVLVAAITGPATPYTVHWKAPTTADTTCGAASCPWPEISNSCVATDGSHADPAVRVSQLVSEFGRNGLLLSICDASFAPALDRIAQLISQSLTPPCIPQAIATKAGSSDPDCTVVSHTSSGAGAPIDAPVPYCGSNGGAVPCWQLEAGPCTDGSSGQIVRISADPTISTEASQNATVDCALAQP
jgi:hypothetical protein